MAIPSFWVALMIVLSLVLTITWRPPLTIAYFWDDPLRNLQMTAGPALALGVALAAMMARIRRSSVLEVLGEDYVRTARAKGLRERIVVWRHALVNAMLPILTVTGTALGALLGGSVAVERAFGVPGLGLAGVRRRGARLDAHPEPRAALRRHLHLRQPGGRRQLRLVRSPYPLPVARSRR